jgi:hypothetical protein
MGVFLDAEIGKNLNAGGNDDVAGAAGTDTDDYADRPRRIDLRVNLRHQHEQTNCNQPNDASTSEHRFISHCGSPHLSSARSLRSTIPSC